MEKAIEMVNISKAFGAIKANENVNLVINTGEVHALLGENGAGKSTLMNMLSGIYTPDSGSIFVFGNEVKFSSPKEPIALGIGMIHQHFKLVDVLSAKENIILGQKGSAFIGKKALEKEIRKISNQYALDVEPNKKVYEMSVGEKQTLEIVKVLYRGAKILILDEPTAVLTPQEIKRFFRIIRNMKEQGCAIIIITHKLGEVMEISDKVTVLHRGQTAGTVNTADVKVDNLIEMMVGEPTELTIGRKAAKEQNPLLEVERLTVLNQDHVRALDEISFTLNSGEILGVAGVAGSGQKELCETIAGLTHAKTGQITFEEDDILGKTPREIIKLGIRMGFIPEDRLGMGLVGGMDIVSNLILKDYHSQPGIFLKKKHLVSQAQELVERLSIKTPSIFSPVRKLSGGNIQKVLLGREIGANPKVLITSYPVRGLDINTSYKIYDLLNDQRQKGVGILFIGEDLDVLIELCDRIMVLCDGEITGVVDARKTTKEQIGLLMTGERLEQEVV